MNYLTIPEGTPIFDGSIDSKLVCSPSEANEEFLKHEVKHFPDGYFYVSSEQGDTTDFLSFISYIFNEWDVEVLDDVNRLFVSNEYGKIMFQYDQGYMHLWVETFTVVQKLHDWFLSYQLNKPA
tara:strand:+ start:348 stop:719 length:372 start_codon:yes stop_codon:yes gene_type:complete